MTIARTAGWILAAAALASLAVECGLFFRDATYAVWTIGGILAAVAEALSFDAPAPAREGPFAGALAILAAAPAWAVLGVPAVLLLWAAGPRRAVGGTVPTPPET
ncbi:MAG: hypothetical protein ACK4QW_08450 [Alphaproteobacteria bacterium]